jgi:hypothetical protein
MATDLNGNSLEQALFSETPEYKQVIKAGLDARRV